MLILVIYPFLFVCCFFIVLFCSFFLIYCLKTIDLFDKKIEML